ncbi:MAG TPA: amidohydrolase family protein [Candidatus Acidoferrum sp.]|nr:amidohydrolase family protein [Candidatus Acidoferrum sp.]
MALGRPQGVYFLQKKQRRRAYTTGSTYAEFEEGKKGALREGEYADFLILSNDLTKVPPTEYGKTRVLRTVVAGRTVFQEK